MSQQPSNKAPKLVGNADLLWVAIIVGASALFIGVMLKQLHLEFETLRLAHEHSAAALEIRRLEEEGRRLDLEAPVRSSASDSSRKAAEGMGLGPAKPAQVIKVKGP
jgi:hypothetical protein